MKLVISRDQHGDSDPNTTEDEVWLNDLHHKLYVVLEADGLAVDLFEADSPLAEHDSIQWSVSLEQLVADAIDYRRRRGELAVDIADRPELFALAERLEQAAAMIRSVEFFDRAAHDAQFGPSYRTALGLHIPGWKPYPIK